LALFAKYRLGHKEESAMRAPVTLSRYIIRQFLVSSTIIFLTFTLLIILLDALELVRRSHNHNIPAATIVQMSLLKFPEMGQRILPFILLIGAVLSYSKMTRMHELIVARAAGVSVWQFLMPTIATSFLIGVVVVTIINPLSCIMISRYEQLEDKHFQRKTGLSSVGKSGTWFRQKEFSSETSLLAGETIIHALEATDNDDNVDLREISIFVFKDPEDLGEHIFTNRIDAAEARLLEKYWHLKQVVVTAPGKKTISYDEYFLETDLTSKDIQNSLASPETIPVWQLPAFISTLQKSGFSASTHILHWHNLLASPFLYAGMILVASLFSLRPTRMGKSGALITASIVTGFLIYFFTSVISSLGLSGSLSLAMAAWIPVIVVVLTSVGLLLHFEDG